MSRKRQDSFDGFLSKQSSSSNSMAPSDSSNNSQQQQSATGNASGNNAPINTSNYLLMPVPNNGANQQLPHSTSAYGIGNNGGSMNLNLNSNSTLSRSHSYHSGISNSYESSTSAGTNSNNYIDMQYAPAAHLLAGNNGSGAGNQAGLSALNNNSLTGGSSNNGANNSIVGDLAYCVNSFSK